MGMNVGQKVSKNIKTYSSTTFLPPKKRPSKCLYFCDDSGCLWYFWEWDGMMVWWLDRSDIWGG